MAAPMRLSRVINSSNLLRFQQIYSQSVPIRKYLRPYVRSGNKIAELDEAKYPPIPPPKESKGELIRVASEPVIAAETPAEMIYALNKWYTWNHLIHPYAYHHGFVNFYKHIMKTEIVEGFPDTMKSWIESEEVQKMTEKVSETARNIVLNNHAKAYRHKQHSVLRERDVGTQLCKNLMSHLIPCLTASNPHLTDADVDIDVDVQSFWPRGSHKFYQFLGKPLVTVRTKDPLPEFVERDAEVCKGDVEDWPYEPNTISIFKKCGNAQCFPGFKHGGGHLNAHTQLYLMADKRVTHEEKNLLQDILQGQGISTSFGWLNALALYQQHCCYIDIPRPMTCQTIVTDGRYFSFYCYQLNTLRLDELMDEGPEARNVCWQVIDLPLMSDVEEDRVVDFNEDVIKTMVAFLANPTVAAS